MKKYIVMLLSGLTIVNFILIVMLLISNNAAKPLGGFKNVLNVGVHVDELKKVYPETPTKNKIQPNFTPNIKYKVPDSAVWEYSYSVAFGDTYCYVYTDAEDYVVGYYWFYVV